MSTRNGQGHKVEGNLEGGGPYDDLDGENSQGREFLSY